MACWPHFEQASRWPPSAAVRQFWMARKALSFWYPKLAWHLLRKRLPWARRMSATSTVGRLIFSCGDTRDSFLEPWRSAVGPVD
jgi:hypothetical protein